MNRTTTSNRTTRLRVGLLAAGLLAGSAALAACGGGSSKSSTPSADTTQTSGSPLVLPVTTNPITNPSTVEALTIDSVLVENNVDASGNDVSDHLEVALTNAGSTELGGFEVFYTITDPTTGDAESYYTRLPDTFTVAPGASRSIHFDSTGGTDHFPDNQYSLYHTSINALDVTVEVSATGAAPQTMTVTKDAGGEEEAD